MKKFSNLIAVLSISVMLLSLATSCKAPAQIVQVQHDSIYVTRTITVRDTFFKTPAAQVSITIPVDSFKKDLKPVSKQNQNARITISKKGNVITADCTCDTLAIKAQLISEVQNTFHSQSDIRTEIKEVKYIPGWVKFLAWSGAIFWIALLVFVGFKILK